MIFRDDDISHLTKVEEFKKVHEFFNEYKCIHTIALLTKDIRKNPELIDYIKSQDNINVQVHSYEHIDFALVSEEEVRNQLNTSFNIITNIFGKTPTIFYPPFNAVNDRVIEIAKECGLETSYEKSSCVYYIRHNGNIAQKVINFHYADYIESILIGVCLKIYSERGYK